MEAEGTWFAQLASEKGDGFCLQSLYLRGGYEEEGAKFFLEVCTER